MAHALTTHLGQGDLDATLFADHTAVLQTLVLTAQAFVVFNRTKDSGAEQPVTLWLERSIVDRLWLLYFAERPRTYHVRRRKTDAQRIKFFYGSLCLEYV